MSAEPLVAGSAQVDLDSVDEAIIQDHKHIKSCYQNYLSEADLQKKTEYANELIRSIAVHSACEELVVYPYFEKNLPDGQALADHSREEHLQVKKDLYNLDKMSREGTEFSALLRKIMDELTHHVEEEETKHLPLFRQNASPQTLRDLAKEWYKKQKAVPTRPHPSAPDKPPLETLAGMMAAPMDKAKDMFRDFPQETQKKVHKQ